MLKQSGHIPVDIPTENHQDGFLIADLRYFHKNRLAKVCEKQADIVFTVKRVLEFEYVTLNYAELRIRKAVRGRIVRRCGYGRNVRQVEIESIYLNHHLSINIPQRSGGGQQEDTMKKEDLDIRITLKGQSIDYLLGVQEM